MSSESCQTWTMNWLQERKKVALHAILYDACTVPASRDVLTKLAPLEHPSLVECNPGGDEIPAFHLSC